MLPARNNKIDLSKLTDEERKIFKLYGKLPTGKDILTHKLKERKYFDSGDYALSKAGKAQGPVGSQHPSPETVPHANAIASQTHNSSPVKESSLVHETEIPKGADSAVASAVPAPAAPAVSISSMVPAPAAPGAAPVHAPAPVTPSAVPEVTVPVRGSSAVTPPAAGNEGTTPADATQVTTSASAPDASGSSAVSADPPDDATVAPVASPIK